MGHGQTSLSLTKLLDSALMSGTKCVLALFTLNIITKYEVC